MNLSKKLRLAAVVPAVMTLVIGAGMYSSYVSIRSLEEEEKAAVRISSDLDELNDLARAFALRHDERPRRQFLWKHGETTKLIASAVFGDRKRRQLQERVAIDTEAVKTLFLKLVSNYELHPTTRDDALQKEAEERLVGQLAIRSREASTDTRRLLDLISHDVVANQRRIYTLSLAFMTVVAVPFAMILLGLMRSIAASLERLKEGAEIVGGGDLDHRIGISSEDEVGAVAKAFDRMSERLRAATVSRDELAVEVAQRKRAEEAVLAAKEGLERHVAERTAELAESEARFRSLVENSPVGIFIVRDGRVVFRNPEQARLFGAMPENFEFREFRDVHPEDASKFGMLLDSISAGGEPAREIDLRFYPYGTSSEGVGLRWAHVKTSAIEYGGKKAVLVSMADITRLKEMEYQFLVREKMASLGNVAAGMAHEIRNPLSGINIYLSALEKFHEESECLGAEGKEQAAGIVRQVQSASERIESVIKKVMDFVRPVAVPAGPADIDLAIANAIDFTAVELRRRGITLDRSGLESLPKCVADRSLLLQVIINLITNAAEAMEVTQGPKVIGVSSTFRDGRIVIRVSDSGPGVPPALRGRIFDPFFTTRKNGYGIGLSFCRRVVADHKGLLAVDVSRWGGAEFRIEIPGEPVLETVSRVPSDPY